MKLISRLTIIFDRIIDAMTVFAGILLIVILLIVNMEVVFRYFLRSPFGWTVEISTYILLYITFLVSAWLLKAEGHVSIDIALKYLNPRTRSVVNMTTSSICAIVCLILTWYGAKVTIDLYRVNYFTPSLLQTPKCVIIGIIFVGSFMLFIQFLRRIHGYFKVWKGESEKERGILEKAEPV